MEGVKRGMLEKQIEGQLGKGIRSLNGLYFKFVSPGNAGVPDRIVVLPNGRTFFVELKRPGEKLRPLQKKTIEMIRDKGAYVEVVDSLASIDALISRLGDELD